MGGEDQDCQRIHEPDHHAARDEPHQAGNAKHAHQHLNNPGQDHGGQQVVHPVGTRDGRHHQGDGARRGRDHRGSSAKERDRDGHGEGGEQAKAGVDACDHGERNGLGNQRECHHEAGEHLGAQEAR